MDKSQTISLIQLFCVLISLFIFSRFLPNGSFLDEHEQVTAGWFISQGLIPYRDFFSHHGPLPLFFGCLAFVLPHSFSPLLILRTLVLLFQFLSLGLVWKVSSSKFRWIITGLLIVLAMSAPMFQIHMVLATTFTTLSLLVIGLLMWQMFENKRLSTFMVALLFSFYGWVAVWSSIATIMPLGLFVISFSVIYRKRKIKFTKRQLVQVLVFNAVLHGSIVGYFILHHAWDDMLWSIITYNSQFYFPFRLAETAQDKQFGPLYYTLRMFLQREVVAITTFLKATKVLLQSIFGVRLLFSGGISLAEVSSYLHTIWREYLSIVSPITITLYVVNTAISMFLIIKKKWFGVWFVVVTVSLYFRSNEIFHLSPVYVWTWLGILYLVVESWSKKKNVSYMVAGSEHGTTKCVGLV